MPKFKLKGFPQGAPVSLSVTQGGETASGAVTRWNEVSMTRFDISVLDNRLTLKTGEAAFFRPINIEGFDVAEPTGGTIYDRTDHEMTWIAEWDDAGHTWTAPENMPSQWRDASIGYGKLQAHAWRTEGTKTVRFWTIDQSGKTAEKTVDITVEARTDAMYPGTQTICFDPDNVFDGAPAGCARAVSISEFNARQNALNTAAPARILFARGMDYQVGSGQYFDLSGKWIDYIGTFGTGGTSGVDGNTYLRPYRSNYIFTLFAVPATMDSLVIEGLRMPSTLNMGTGEGSPGGSPVYAVSLSGPSKMNFSYIDCDLDGHYFNPIQSATLPVRAYVEGCTNGNSIGYLCYLGNCHDDTHFAMVGSRFTHNVDTPSNLDVFWGGGSVLRNPDCLNGYLEGNDFFTRSGWPAYSSMRKDVKAEGSAIRWNTAAESGARLNMARCVFEGGETVISLTGAGSFAGDPGYGNYVLDKCIIIGAATTSSALCQIQHAGITRRNCLGFYPDVTRWREIVWGAINLADGSSGADTGKLDTPYLDYANTDIALDPSSNKDGYSLWGNLMAWINYSHPWTNTAFDNEVAYAPNLSPPVSDGGTLDLVATIPGITTRHRGVLADFPQVDGTLSSTVGNGQSFTVPYSQILDGHDGSATSLGYWQALEAANTAHRLLIDNSYKLAQHDDFSVVFTSAGAEIINTSGSVWSSGSAYTLRLDRHTIAPAAEPGTDTSGRSVPLARPLDGSDPANTAIEGLRCYDDLLLGVRPGPGNQRNGSGRPAGTDNKGCLLET